MHRLTIALATLGGIVVVAFVGYFFFIGMDAPGAQRFRNVTGSMEPALLNGDRFTVIPLARNDKERVVRGSLVTHRWPEDPTKQFVKRIVGVPGDTLAMVNGALRVNGRELSEPYAWQEDPAIDPVIPEFSWQRQFLVGPARADSAHYVASRNTWGPIALPAHRWFVLGDNRDNSLDSRYWGLLETDDLVGIPRRVYFSRDPTTGRIRWSRFGRHLR